MATSLYLSIPSLWSYVVSILLSEMKLCLPSIQYIPFIEISFHPEVGAIGFTKSIKYDKTGNRNVLSFTFTPWMYGNFNISGRILFPRLIQSRDLPLNIERLGSEIRMLARTVQLNLIPPTAEVALSTRVSRAKTDRNQNISSFTTS